MLFIRCWFSLLKKRNNIVISSKILVKPGFLKDKEYKLKINSLALIYLCVYGQLKRPCTHTKIIKNR